MHVLEVPRTDSYKTILLTKITAAQKEVALIYHRVLGLYFLTVFFYGTIILLCLQSKKRTCNYRNINSV